MELDHQGPDREYMTQSEENIAVAKGGGEGIRQRHARQDSERQAKGLQRIGDSEHCVCINAMLIFLTFHGLYCFAVTITDRDDVKGG